ncbi:MAG TPA: lysylphosphatidylglycerol synthase transmembrane domain-containing protein [Anaerolineales bacterium]|nr:lysylphosphatidylglycerol synthase transmembrane domain-containing protein [Anaerolineales bacterium]
MRKLILAVVVLLAILFIISRQTDITQIVGALQRGVPHWLLLAIFIHLISVLNNGVTIRSIYRLLGLGERVGRLMMLWLASVFFTIVTSSGGWGGMVVFVTDGRKRGLPGARVTVALAMYYLFDFVAALTLVGLGLVVLIRRGRLETGEVVATAILAVYATVLASWLVLAWRSPDRLGTIMTGVGSVVNRLLRRFLHRDYLDVGKARALAHDMAAGLTDLRHSRGGLLIPLALSLSHKALMISILFFCFLAFSQPFSAGTLIAAYAIAYMFTVVTPTPAGIGLIEGILTVALAGIGVPLATAALIALAYSGVTLWLPLLYGMLTFRWVGLGASPKTLDINIPTAPVQAFPRKDNS